jgi:hypothetical protein
MSSPGGPHPSIAESERIERMAVLTIASQAPSTTLSVRFLRFYQIVVAVQGIHVIEHIIQLFQVYVLGVAEDDALGLLGYVFVFNGTEEWLHLVFNLSYLVCLYVIFAVIVRAAVRRLLPMWVFVGYAIAGVGVETWHSVEHGVIIRNVLRNDGCPCPGIVDAALGVSDTQLHFGYNLIAYAGTVLPYVYFRTRRIERG